MRWRAILAIAIVAALLWAPSAVSAAPPNQLTGASVTPHSGTTATTFVFSTRYVSSGDNPATGVVASVAGRTVKLSLASGSKTDGTWTGSAKLPSGTWSVAFAAQADRGPRPKLDGPTLRVAAQAKPPASPKPPAPRQSPALVPAEPGPTATPAPQQPQPPTTPAPAGPAAKPTASDAPGGGSTRGGSGGSGGGAGPAGSGGGGGGGANAPAASAGTGAAKGGKGHQAPRASHAADLSDPAFLPSADGDQAMLWTVMLLGIAGVGLVALAGFAWIMLARRDEEEPSGAAAGSAAGSRGTGEDAANMAVPVLERRAMRRARLKPSNDPILAAMGLPQPDDEPAPPKRTRASQVNSGPGERVVETRRTRPSRRDT